MSTLFLDQLAQGPLLCDGAIGTLLYERAGAGVMHGGCFEELVLTAPTLVREVHREYIVAGAQVIETNTFGANAIKLAAYGAAGEVREINRRAAQLAREARDASGQSIFVAGAVGPSGRLLFSTERDENLQLNTLRDVFREQVEALIEGGVDLLILETFSSLIELQQAVLAAREAGDLPLVAQVSCGEDGSTLSGETPTNVALALAALSVDVIGVNCSIGPTCVLDAVEKMEYVLGGHNPDQKQSIYVSAQPNAGLPTRVDNRLLYPSTPRYFAEYAQRFATAGVRLIGACCGTRPVHIAAMREALADVLPAHPQPKRSIDNVVLTPAPLATARLERSEADDSVKDLPPTRWRQELIAGRFAVSVGLEPVKGLSLDATLKDASYLKSQGIQFINIADSATTIVRMSSIALARLINQHFDLDAIVRFATRDRNLMAVQSDLLGAHALGVRDILALTGDPLQASPGPTNTGVWDLDSIGLIRILSQMNAGQDAKGASLGMQARFHIGASVNLNADDEIIDIALERARHRLLGVYDLADLAKYDESGSGKITGLALELERLRRKLNAGAQFIVTQPVYDLPRLERFLAKFGPTGVPIIVGIIPLQSLKHAEYLHHEVPGISIPVEVRARIGAAGSRAPEVGIEVAREVLTAARSHGLIQGCCLLPSYGRYELVGELAHELLRTIT